MKVRVAACFQLKWLASLVGIAFLLCLGSFQVGLDEVNNLLSLCDMVRAKDHPFARLDPVHRCTATTAIQSFEGCHSETPDSCCCMRTQPTIDTCPICLGSSAHKLRAYPQEYDLPSPSDHQSMNGKLSCGSDAALRKYAAAPRSERRTRALGQK
jgi:hypothetical protein